MTCGTETAPAWRCITCAPRDGTTILASGVDLGVGFDRHYAVARWERCEHPDPDDWSGWYAPDGDDGPYLFLTHWMPLPPHPSVPKSAKRGGEA